MHTSSNFSSLGVLHKTSANISGDTALNRAAANGTVQGCPVLGVHPNSTSSNATFPNSTLLNEVFSNDTLLNGTFTSSTFLDCQFSSGESLDTASENDTLSEGVFSSLDLQTSTFRDGKYSFIQRW